MSTLTTTPVLTTSGRYRILVVAFLGWFCAGMDMATTQLIGKSAAIDLLERTGELDRSRFEDLNTQAKAKTTLSAGDQELLKQWEAQVAGWFAWYNCAFLLGAATGGLIFGWLGDRIGRAKGMALSIITYSALAGVASLAQTPLQLLALWFLACTGVGGMWPNGVALVSEAWATMSRPLVAGVIGTSANIGIFLLSTIATRIKITPDEWRWVMLVVAAPLALGVFALVAVPESPRWLATRGVNIAGQTGGVSMAEVFQPPLLGITIVGIALATIPMIGGWGSASWMIPWADSHGAGPFLKAEVSQYRAVTGIVGSLLGGWIANMVGRRRTYLLTSLIALAIAQYTFWFLVPTDRDFLLWVAALGFFSGIYFGWLPLCLPELFPTRVRSSGAGVSFNFGRILTALTLFATGTLTAVFGGIPQIGRVTSLIFLFGILTIWLAPDTSRKQLAD